VDPPEAAFYTSLTQAPIGRQTIVVQADVPDPASLIPVIRHEVQSVDPMMPVDAQLVTDLVGSTIERQQLGMMLMLGFGAMAVALAMIGIYGVIAYATAQRRAEVATRLALGATPGDVFRLVIRQGRVLVITGAVIGLLLAYLSGRLIASRIHAVQAGDPWILSAAAAVVVVIALLATMVPAYRAATLEPARALRQE
jgi:putative ABC transport system permease protein